MSPRDRATHVSFGNPVKLTLGRMTAESHNDAEIVIPSATATVKCKSVQ